MNNSIFVTLVDLLPHAVYVQNRASITVFEGVNIEIVIDMACNAALCIVKLTNSLWSSINTLPRSETNENRICQTKPFKIDEQHSPLEIPKVESTGMHYISQ